MIVVRKANRLCFCPNRGGFLLRANSAVLYQRANGSIVELVRFNLESFDLPDQYVAALFGLELARLVVATSYAALVAKRKETNG